MKQITSNYKKYTSKNPLQKFLINNFFKSIEEMIDGLKVESVLDVGCGEGFTLDRLSKLKKFKELEGIDFSKEAILLGNKLHPHLKLKQANIYQLPYKDSSFDLVISTEVLEHLENPKKALREIIRVSKKYVLLSVPNEPFFRLANFLRGKNILRLGNDIGHIQHWSSKGFEEFIKSEKVKILKKSSPFPWTMVLVERLV